MVRYVQEPLEPHMSPPPPLGQSHLDIFRGLGYLQLPIPKVPSPSPQNLDHSRGNGSGERNSDEYEGLVHGVGQRQLSPETCMSHRQSVC